MGRTDRASRVIDADPAAVWDAFVDPAALVRWLPPTGMTARFDHVDLRPGGSYRLVLTHDDPAATHGKASPDTDIVDADVLDVVPGERLVQRVDFESDDPAFAGTMTMTWQLTPTDAGTLVDFVADDVPPGISAEDHAAGMSSSLENLAAFLAR